MLHSPISQVFAGCFLWEECMKMVLPVFLQTHECKMENRTKVKFRKWIDIPDFGKYEKFISTGNIL